MAFIQEDRPFWFLTVRHIRSTRVEHTCSYCNNVIPVGAPCVRYTRRLKKRVSKKKRKDAFEMRFGCAPCERSVYGV